ncbi:MAG: hypothetical protein ABJA98_22070 [Acidobacteriota bacterium]
MPLTVREFEIVIGKLHMVARESKHRFVWLEHEGKKILYTERSHGRGDIGRVEHAIRRQLKVNSAQFRDLVNCPMTRELYIEHLKKIGAIDADN